MKLRASELRFRWGCGGDYACGGEEKEEEFGLCVFVFLPEDDAVTVNAL
ncbi:hypothetical protein L195_g026327 [Trifolium pratense]|uniref:Uncharacterized protein n=1 Tax=Trifolium pratense TaxID=57577 RepID=A0A2K3NIY4_TRIPR|nr:hypothetical protein L195_g026327 [Trifolium pratense]